jgi:quinol monooxygenase YgiN
MHALQVTARLTIHDGKLEEFKELARQCMGIVRERDSGTQQYDWFFNEDHTQCVVRETYTDSKAALEHIANLGPTLGAIFGVSDMALEIYGSPSEELLAAISGLAPKIYAPFQGLG